MAGAYREIIIRGDENIMKGFLACYRSTHRIRAGLILARDYPINRHHLKEVLHLRRHYLHLIAAKTHYRGFMAALRPVIEELELEVLSDRSIRRAWFEYHFSTANRRVAGTIKRAFSRLPGDTRRSGRAHQEIVDPSVKGVEVYSPAHEYEYSGEGQVAGDLEALLKLHAKFKAHEFIDVEDIGLRL